MNTNNTQDWGHSNIDPTKFYWVPNYYPPVPFTPSIPVYPAPQVPVCPGCGRCRVCGQPNSPNVTITYGNTSQPPQNR